MAALADRPDVLVVGGGPAAAALVHELRRADDRAPVVRVLTEEDRPPYDRTYVSKGVLRGEVDRPPALFGDALDGVVTVAARVVEVDPDAHRVVLADGSVVGFDRLVLATGAAPRTLPLPGADLPGVGVLRSAAEGEALAAQLARGGRLVILGAGVIGLEVAAAASERGVAVTVLELATTPMARVLPAAVTAPLLDRHRTAGTDVRLGVRPVRVDAADDGLVVTCEDGTVVVGDQVLVAVGVRPSTALAEAAGLEVDDGIVVDELLTTSHADVLAIGDAVRVRAADGTTTRTESYTAAMGMGQHAARTLLGHPSPYREVPWSWSDQHDLTVQAAGWPDRADRWVARGTAGDLDAGLFAFGVQGSRVVAAAGISRGRAVGRVVRGAVKLVEAGVAVDDAALADPSVDVRALARPPR